MLGDPIRQVPRNGTGEPYLAERGFLIGPDDAAMLNEPSGGTWAVGDRRHTDRLRRRVRRRSTIDPRPGRRSGRLAGLRSARLAVRPPVRTRRSISVEDALARALSPVDPGLQRVASAVACARGSPTRPIAELADELGISHGHLDREFGRIVGLSPRVLSRVLRLRALVALDRRATARSGWTALASELGWFDQAHLIRDFRRFTGVTPGEYAAAIRERYTPRGGAARVHPRACEIRPMTAGRGAPTLTP